MNIDNLFQPGKWFVLFCGLFILVWGALQFVGNLRLSEEARFAASHVFTWDWTERGWSTKCSITDVSILHRTSTDATVMVNGNQSLCGQKSDKFSALLSFYRLSNKWVLGKVELP